MTDYLNYQTITKWRINVETGKVEHLQGFTRPISGTGKAPKKQTPTKELDIGDVEDEVFM